MILVDNITLPIIKKSFSYKFEDGNIYYVASENGVGKTLLLDCISGLYKNIRKDIVGNDDIIYINQTMYFYKKLKGLNLLEYVYKINNNKPLDSFFDFVENFYEISKIAELLNKKWGSLSGGEQRFLLCLILLSTDKQWYLLDEPFSFLDKSKKQILVDMINYLLINGKGIIFTSHEDIDYKFKKELIVIDLKNSLS